MKAPTSMVLALALAAGVVAGPVSKEDIDAAVGAKKADDVLTAFVGKGLDAGKAKLKSTLEGKLRDFVDGKLDALPESARRTVLRDALAYVEGSQGDLDSLMKAGVDGDADEVLAKTGGLMASALQAATARLEDSDDPALKKLFAAGKGIQDLIAPVEQLAKGAGYLAEGRYTDAGKEFALAIPGVKAVHDRVVSIAETEKKAFEWLQDQAQEAIYQRFKADGYSTRQDLDLLMQSGFAKGMLRNLKLRYGWKSDEEALRNIHKGMVARVKAEAAAAAQQAKDKKALTWALDRRLLVLPDPLPPPGAARSAALRAALADLRASDRTIRTWLENASGVAPRQWRGGSTRYTFDLLQLMRSYKAALRSGDRAEVARLRAAIKAKLAEQAAALKAERDKKLADDPCAAVPPAVQEEIDRELLLAGKDQVASVLRKRLGKDSQALLNCICRVHSGASIGVGTSYHPAPSGSSGGCADPKGGPCMSSGYGCWRTPLKADAKALAACGTSVELARQLCRRAGR